MTLSHEAGSRLEQQTSNEGSGRFHNHGVEPTMYYALPHLRLPDFASVLCPNYMSTFLGLTLVYHNVLNFNQDRDCEIFAKVRLKL